MTPHGRRIVPGLPRRGFAFAPIGNRAERLMRLYPQPLPSCSCSIEDVSLGHLLALLVRRLHACFPKSFK
jgi:hypothetical protein